MSLVLFHALFPDVVHEVLADRTYVVAPDDASRARALADAEAIVTLLDVRIDDALLAGAPRLRVVANVAVGVDNIDLAACGRRGVKVVNTPDVLTASTAELAVTLALAVLRRVHEGEALARSGAWTGWALDQLLGRSLVDARVVVVGPGRIGRRAAELFGALGARVTTLGRHDDEDGIRAALATADVVSLHLPLTDATRGWLSAARLGALPSSAVVINTARGPIVDEEALIAALEGGRLGGAGLDVYAGEPEIPARLRGRPDVVLLPHLGSATVQTRRAMVRLALTGACAVLDGGTPANLVRARPDAAGA